MCNPSSIVFVDMTTTNSSSQSSIGEDKRCNQSFDELISEAHNLEIEDLHDPMMVSEYANEIFEYMKKLEIATLPDPNYMDKQRDLDCSMRKILVNTVTQWNIHLDYLPETLYLAINIIDRFLSYRLVSRQKLYLVGVTALFIASKYEEIRTLPQNFVVLATSLGFTEEYLFQAERFIMSTLNYDLSYPNPLHFLRRISKADDYNIQTRTMGKYLLQISCLDYRFLKHPPSLIAAAAMYLARVVVDNSKWDALCSKYAGYEEEEIIPVFNLMAECLYNSIDNACSVQYGNSKLIFSRLFGCFAKML